MAPRIVVVDADLPTLALMHDLLAPEGYRVDCASTTEAGLQAARQERPDLIILDLRVGAPGAGSRLLDRLRGDPSTANLPIIACSTDHRDLHARRAWLRDRNCATLAKPFEFEDLLECVTAAVPVKIGSGHGARYRILPCRPWDPSLAEGDAPRAVVGL